MKALNGRGYIQVRLQERTEAGQDAWDLELQQVAWHEHGYHVNWPRHTSVTASDPASMARHFIELASEFGADASTAMTLNGELHAFNVITALIKGTMEAAAEKRRVEKATVPGGTQ